MLRRIPKVLLLLALLAAFGASIAPAFGSASACGCYRFVGDRIFRAPGEDVISTKALCNVSARAAGGFAVNLVESHAAQGPLAEGSPWIETIFLGGLRSWTD